MPCLEGTRRGGVRLLLRGQFAACGRQRGYQLALLGGEGVVCRHQRLGANGAGMEGEGKQ